MFYLACHLALHIFGQGIFQGKHLCFFAYSSSAASLLDALSDLPALMTSKHNRTVSSMSEGHYPSTNETRYTFQVAMKEKSSRISEISHGFAKNYTKETLSPGSVSDKHREGRNLETQIETI